MKQERFDFTPTSPTRKVGPIGVCIYCGASEYEPDSDARLGDEHVIPRGMGGRLILLQASCRACEDAIKPFEQWVMGRIWLSQRQHLGFRSKNKNRPKLLKFREADGRNPVDIDLDRMFLPAMMPVMGMENWRNAENYVNGKFTMRFCFTTILPTGDELERVKKDVTDPVNIPLNFSFPYFCRFMAKIAHGLMVDLHGVHGFEPALNNFILGREDHKCYYYVGSFDQPPITATDGGLAEMSSAISDTVFTPDGELILISNLRFFSVLPFPTYVVYAGRPLRHSTMSDASL